MAIAWKAATTDARIASFRFRVRQPIETLAARGHAVEMFDEDRAADYAAVVFSKGYGEADRRIAAQLKASGTRVLFDICDNHFYNPSRLPRYEQARRDLLAMIGLADRVIVSSAALAEVIVAEAPCAAAPVVVGDFVERIDLSAYPGPAGDGRPTLLWFGSHGSPNAPSGMADLLRIAPRLRAAAARTPFELLVVSNNRAKFDSIRDELGVPAHYEEWALDHFPAHLAAATAVLLPLSDNPFVACKTHNRLTTALWAGVPVIADPIDAYREFAPFCYLGDWDDGLRAVLNRDEAPARAKRARAYIDRHWSDEIVATLWEEALSLPPSQPSSGSSQPVSRPAARFERSEPSVFEPDYGRAVEPVLQSPGGLAAGALVTGSGTRAASPGEGGAHRPASYQGAVDPVRGAVITGWARRLGAPGVAVEVVLTIEGAAVARARADRPRADLAAAGFSSADHGFELPLPEPLAAGWAGEAAVMVDGVHLLERIDRAPCAAGRARPRVAENPAAQPAPSMIAMAPSPSPGWTPGDVQRLLAEQLQDLDEALENVRKIAARITLAACDGPLAEAADASGAIERLAGWGKPDSMVRREA